MSGGSQPELIDRYLGGELDDAAAEELARQLHDDPAARRQCRSQALLDAELRAVLRDDGQALWQGIRLRLAGQGASQRFRARVIDRIRKQRRRPSYGGWIVAAAALLMLAAGLGWFWTARTSHETPIQGIAVLDTASSGARVIRAGQTIDPRAGMALLAQDRIETGTSDTAEVLYPDQTRIEVLASSQLRLWNEDGAKRVHLDRGTVRCAVAHQPVGFAMKLLTDQAEAEILGTRFSLRAEAGVTRLEVTEGTVAFKQADGTVSLVKGGGSAEAGAPAPRTAPTVVLSYDVEDGQRPPYLVDGTIVPGPQRDGSRLCIAGVRKPHGDGFVNEVVIARKDRELFTFAPGTRLSFDCWFTGDMERVYLGVWHPTRKEEMRLIKEPLVRGQWVSVSVTLDDLRLISDPACTFAPGDPIWDITIATAAGSDGQLYIDNLVIATPTDPGPR